MNNQHTLKELQTRHSKLRAELSRLDQERADINKSCMEIGGKIANIDKQIKSMCTNPTVSEHAVLRYLERIDGFDTEVVKAKILNPKTLEQIETLGNGKYPICGKHMAVVRAKVVVSVT